MSNIILGLFSLRSIVEMITSANVSSLHASGLDVDCSTTMERFASMLASDPNTSQRPIGTDSNRVMQNAFNRSPSADCPSNALSPLTDDDEGPSPTHPLSSRIDPLGRTIEGHPVDNAADVQRQQLRAAHHQALQAARRAFFSESLLAAAAAGDNGNGGTANFCNASRRTSQPTPLRPKSGSSSALVAEYVTQSRRLIAGRNTAAISALHRGGAADSDPPVSATTKPPSSAILSSSCRPSDARRKASSGIPASKGTDVPIELATPRAGASPFLRAGDVTCHAMCLSVQQWALQQLQQ